MALARWGKETHTQKESRGSGVWRDSLVHMIDKASKVPRVEPTYIAFIGATLWTHRVTSCQNVTAKCYMMIWFWVKGRTPCLAIISRVISWILALDLERRRA